MLNNEFILDTKSIYKLSSKGLAREHLVAQLDNDLNLSLELWRAQGLDIKKHRGAYFFSTKFLQISDAEFCIVDIETNGSKIDKHQIIEIAAIKIKNGKTIDKFESLVYTREINSYITEITGISVEDTKDAPTLKKVLYEFKEFLGDSIFVAHDVKFDYKFISQSFIKVGLFPLLNRSLCSLSLAEKTLKSFRYGLSYLSEYFDLNPNASHHRAMSDVVTTLALFNLSIKNIDNGIKTVEDLIKFSKEAKKLKRPKLDPLYIEKNNSKEM
ncbi:MAG: 3'-5' exonuclease [Sulfurimonas sp.]|nr:3'-5' exonuclease [Sulfurimonas sp.]